MRHFFKACCAISFVFSLVVSASAQLPSTMPAGDEPQLGKAFRSRVDGIQFNPPANGTMMRAPNNGEIVRFVYPDYSWDLRVKPINLRTSMPLSAPDNGGVLELTATQLKEINQAAQILSLEQKPAAFNGAKVGLIEARYLAGTNVIFAQQAIVEDTPRHFFVVQMMSTGKPRSMAEDAPFAPEDEARRMFRKIVPTLQVLDRQSLADEQRKGDFQTRLLWVGLDRRKLISAMEPLHFMRVLRDGKDIGFIQVDERIATHNGREGVEYIVHSRMQSGNDQAMDAARSQSPASTATGIVVPRGAASPASASDAPAAVRPTNLYTNGTYFVTFDRAHEDWTTTTQADESVITQLTEMANSDLIEKRVLNAEALAEAIKAGKKPVDKDGNPLMRDLPDYELIVNQYARGGHLGKPFKQQLPPFYLPQVIGQMLPRLLPADPAEYFFASYVSNQKDLLARYVEVGRATDVTLDGKPWHAVPISDRIGVDGLPTIHYVTRSGAWIGSVNDDSRLTVLPTDAGTLAGIWRSDKRGFAVHPLDPPPVELRVTPPVPADRQP